MSDALKVKFKQMFRETIDNHHETDPRASFASGMLVVLVVLSALKAKDGPTIAYQIAVMHAALREVGTEEGWGVAKQNPAS